MQRRTIDWNRISIYGILDTGYLPPNRFGSMARDLIAGGVGILQIRAKQEDTQTRLDLADQVLPIAQEAGVPLIMNDDLEAVKMRPGLGLHLGQDDLSVELARECLRDDAILGLSTHSEHQIEGALEAAKRGWIDYFAVGPVFPTQTKPDYTAVTLKLAQWILQRDVDFPFFFIGGINCDSLPALATLGAKRIVVVSDLLLAPNPGARAEELARMLHQ